LCQAEAILYKCDDTCC